MAVALDEPGRPSPVAIVGMACRLPGDVSSPGDLWKILTKGRSCWSKIPRNRFNAEAYHHPNPEKKGTMNSAGGYFVSQDLETFDAGFFDMTKKEAETLDPTQRLLLECSFEAFENAGIPKEHLAGRKVGVFVGLPDSEHRMGNLRDLDDVPMYDPTGAQGAFLAGRIAYYFDLHGPALGLDTACSSSMQALHVAVQSIRSGESETALVGASHLITQPDVWVSMAKLRLFSESGKTHAFDHRAKSGYARGEGVGCLVLKPLHRAVADNDHIWAVIAETGISHNGRTVGIVAPSADEQGRLIRDVLKQSNISPEEIAFFEAHGTGTKVGDPVEATAIYQAVSRQLSARDPLHIGSIKSNIGHLENASGVISVIKAALMLDKQFLVPNADFEAPNPAIPLSKLNLKVPKTQRPWPRQKKYVCVNNFGYSGSNGHAILTSAPKRDVLEYFDPERDHDRIMSKRLYVLSANDEAAMRKSMEKLGIFLEQHAELYQTTMPRNLAYTLGQRRSHMPWRVALVANMCSNLALALNSPDAVPRRMPAKSPKLAFVFTGQGAQWHAMGRELLESHPVFAKAIKKADSHLLSIGADFSLFEELCRDEKESLVGKARISQPICTAVQVALVDLLWSWDIRPSAVTGHSSGEIGAAYAAGALTLESAMSAAYFRGQAIVALKERHPNLQGAMLAVGAGSDECRDLCKTILQLPLEAVAACENSPSSTTVSGDAEAIDQLATVLQEKNVFHRKLFVDVAYHSPHMKLIAEWYHDAIADIQLQKNVSTDVDFFSALRGRKIAVEELGPQYWVDNLTQPVRFATALKALYRESQPDILIEVGPHAALKGPIMQSLKDLKLTATTKPPAYLPTLVRGRDATETCLELAGQLFMNGYDGLNFFSMNHERQEVEQPETIPVLYSYPWSRQRCWYESRIAHQHRTKPFPRHDLLGTLADWSADLQPTWRNILRLDDLPWLRDSRIHERMIFPASAYVSMVIEAASQRVKLLGLPDVGVFDLHDVQIKEQIFLEESEGTEILLTFRPCPEGGIDARDEFQIISYEPKRGWTENCHGYAQARPLKAIPRTTGTCLSHSTSRRRPTNQPNDEKRLAGAHYYFNMGSAGVAYPRGFMNLQHVISDEMGAIGTARIQDTRLDMPMGHETPYKLHPSIIHSMIQVADSDTGLAGTGTPRLPCAFHRVRIQLDEGWRRDPGSRYTVQSNTMAGKPEELFVELFDATGPDPETSLVSILGLEHTTIETPQADCTNPEDLCYQTVWKPAAERQLNGVDKGHIQSHDSRMVIVSTCVSADALVSKVSTILQGSTGNRPTTSELLDVPEYRGFFILVDTAEKSLLSSVTETEWKAVQKLVAGAAGLLWVTCGASKNPTNPNANMILGLLRTARSELACTAATLDLDPNSQLGEDGQAELIEDAFRRSVLSNDPQAEMEFAEKDGALQIPRLAVDEDLNLRLHREIGSSQPYLQPYWQAGRQLQIKFGRKGKPESFYFDNMALEETLGEHEVEIVVLASQITSHDATATSTGHAIGCSGSVTRTGSKVTHCSVNDKVCALTEGLLSTHIRLQESNLIRFPENVSLEEAALIPLSYGTVWYSLVNVAHLRQGEKVLIQLDGDQGLAPIYLAQNRGAKVFVAAAGPCAKATATLRSIRVPVFDPSSLYFAEQIHHATNGHGMDVILTTNSPTWSVQDQERVWATVAPCGRVVQIKGPPESRRCRADKLNFRDNASYAAVDMTKLASTQPHLVRAVLTDVMQWYQSIRGSNAYQPRYQSISLAQLHDALRPTKEQCLRQVVLVPTEDDQVKATHSPASCKLNSEGTHVIVGGTGGLGRSMVRWMVSRGAKHFVLISRSGGRSEKVQQLLDELQGKAKVHIRKCDIADDLQVRSLVHDCSKTMAPICGVINAVMALHDNLFEDMTYDQFKSTTEGKVAGSWNLHNILESSGTQLDYFVVLSSAAGIVGSRGQAAYAAASTFLDSFASYRRGKGLPGVSLDLTAVTGVGYIAENAARAEDISKNFAQTISEDQVLALIALAVSGQTPVQVQTGLKLSPTSTGSLPYYADDARFANLKATALAEMAKTAGSGAEAMTPASFGNAFRTAASETEAQQVAVQGVLHKLSEVLSVGLADVDAARSMTSYGLDSLTAIEIRNWIARELRANLQILELLTSGCVNDLAALVVSRAAKV